MSYRIVRTDTADSEIRKIILYVAENFGNDVALEKLNQIGEGLQILADNPYAGIVPIYSVLKRQGYRVLILPKNYAFYKVDDINEEVTIYSIVDQRQDYLSIIRGL
ncbi:MAG: type II toxin-antitoxin system RelE/ParE family toxin [Eubacteriales bacterium]|nr:type II toxin-antitoxin system RelE/ParE family toxin [Eubacteriales bacterium]